MKMYNPRIQRYSSRQKLLKWVLRNFGRNVGISVSRSSIIPKPSHPLVFEDSSASPSCAFEHNRTSLKPLVNQSRSIHLMNETSITNDNEPKTPLNQELSQCINKTKRTKEDLEHIRLSLLKQPTSDTEKRNALEILLKYKKYSWLEDILKMSDPTSFDIRLMSVLRHILLSDVHSITEVISSFTKSEREQILNQGSEFLIKIERPQKAFLLWLYVTSAEYPDFNLIPSDDTSPYRASLRSILRVLKDPNDIMPFAYSRLSTDTAKSNLSYYLSYSFFKISLKEQAIRVWNATPSRLRTTAHFSQTLSALSLLNRNTEVVEIFKRHTNLHDMRSRRLTINALIHLPFYEAKYYRVFLPLIKEEHLFDHQLDIVLNQLVQHRKLRQFEEVMDYYSRNGLASEIDVINYQMEKVSRSASSSHVVEYIRKIQAIKQKPNSRTFILLLQQFARDGNSKSVVILLNNIAQSNVLKLRTSHYALAIEACAKALDVENLTKIQEMMKENKVPLNSTIIENLMSLHYNLNQFDMVETVFVRSAPKKPRLRMLTILLNSFLSKGDFLSANITYTAIREGGFRETPDYYLAQIDYYATQGLFRDAMELIKRMKANGVKPSTSHFLSLMSNYNRNGRYSDALGVFDLIVKEHLGTDPMVYNQLLVSLIKLDKINKGNFQRPIQVVDEIMKAAQNNELNLKNNLPFIAIKPLVNTLVKFYNPDDAYRIMSNFRVINPEFLAEQRLNYIKQELLLFSKTGKWGSFAVSFDNFQQRIDSLLTIQGVAPPTLKKVYNSVIKVLYRHSNLSNELPKFTKYLHKLIFEQKFTFDSNNLNWLTSRLVRNKDTFHGALEIIEKRLTGGLIAKRLLRFEKVERMAKNERFIYPIRHGHMLRPKLALGYINGGIVRDELYKYILRESKKYGREEVIEGLKSKYPKLMRNLPELFKRLGRRDRFLQKKWELLGLVDGKRPKGTKPLRRENLDL